jgi:ribulose-phosphate 3-epimerase
MEIIPAIMPNTLEQLSSYVEKVRGLVNTIQIDVMDGVFVPPENWPYTEKNTFEDLIYKRAEIPFAKEVSYSADLMIKEPEYELGKWLDVGVFELAIHIESTTNMEKIIEVCDGKIDLGIAINTETPNEILEPYIEKIKYVQFMGIARIGYQGEVFDERVIHKIKDLRQKYPHVTIQVDGSVNLETAPKLSKAGANQLVVGSAIWKSKNIAETIQKLQEL